MIVALPLPLALLSGDSRRSSSASDCRGFVHRLCASATGGAKRLELCSYRRAEKVGSCATMSGHIADRCSDAEPEPDSWFGSCIRRIGFRQRRFLPPIERAHLRSTRCRRRRRNACCVTSLCRARATSSSGGANMIRKPALSLTHFAFEQGCRITNSIVLDLSSANPSRQSQAAPIAGGARVCVLSSWPRLAPNAMRGLTGSVTFARSGSGKQRGPKKADCGLSRRIEGVCLPTGLERQLRRFQARLRPVPLEPKPRTGRMMRPQGARQVAQPDFSS
jgi:hypothetical protein